MVTDAARNEAIYRDFDSAASGADFVFQSKGQKSSRFPQAIEIDWDVDAIPKGPVWIWTAIGDPVDLVQFYARRGLRAERLILKPDHEAPNLAELTTLLEDARVAGARVAITEKDAVKFPAELRHRCLILRRSLRMGGSMNAIFERLQ
jgi:tetraacyldisaccharide-1-P 4'-kinase